MKNYIWIVVIGLIYLTLSITNPINSTSLSLGLSEIQIRLLQITIAVPFIGSWIAGAVGYSELRTYVNYQKNTFRAIPFHRIALSILILVISSIVTTFIGTFRTRFGPTIPEIIPITTVISNYVHVFLPLVGVGYIFSAMSSLSHSVKAPDLPSLPRVLGFLFPIAVTVLNVYLTFTNITRQTTYYLSDILIVCTIILPSTLTWLIGILSVLYAQNYQHYAKGTVFQSALNRFTWGILLVIIASMTLQLLQALGTTRLLHFGLAGILIVVYVFVAVQTTGFILIALGSKKFLLVEKILSKYTNPNSYDTTSETH